MLAQRRLAHPGGAADQHQPAVAGGHIERRVGQRGELALPSDEVKATDGGVADHLLDPTRGPFAGSLHLLCRRAARRRHAYEGDGSAGPMASTTPTINTEPPMSSPLDTRTTHRRRRLGAVILASAGLVAAAAHGADASTPPTTPTPTTDAAHRHGHDRHGPDMAPMADVTMAPADRAAAQLATAAFQDVGVAEAAGYASTLDTLGCFQDPTQGGMGLHYLDQSLMDATVDIAHPEALVYELAADGTIAGLVAHEYIVPIEAWTSADPPSLFGVDFHRHPSLPLWVLHTWIWKDNVNGVFADWNPAVRQCPTGVPIFGVDLP